MRSKTHKQRIIEVILKQGQKTATNFHYISNANQYLVDLEKIGILKSEWGKLGSAKVKFRTINDKDKALKFLEKRSAKSVKDEVQKSHD